MGLTEWLIILAIAALLFRARQVGRATGGVAGEFLAGARGAGPRPEAGRQPGPGPAAAVAASDRAHAERRRLLAVLELPPDASLEQIERAWRDLVKVWHPDRFARDTALQARATARLAEINAAHERLTQAPG